MFPELGILMTRLLQCFSFHFLHISLNSGVLKYQSHSKSTVFSFSHSVQIEEQFVGDILENV